MVLKNGKDFEGFRGEEKEGLGFDGKKGKKKTFLFDDYYLYDINYYYYDYDYDYDDDDIK
jgi:hypothetical protein